MNNPTTEQTLYWVVGALGVPLIQWLKKRFTLSGTKALWLSLAVAVLLSAIMIFINGGFSFETATPNSVLAVIGQVVTASMVVYKLLIADK